MNQSIFGVVMPPSAAYFDPPPSTVFSIEPASQPVIPFVTAAVQTGVGYLAYTNKWRKVGILLYVLAFGNVMYGLWSVSKRAP